MNFHHHPLQKTEISFSFGFQSAVAFHFRRPRAIVHLVVACVCAFRHCFAARGSLHVGHLSVNDTHEPTSETLVSIRAPFEVVQYGETGLDKHAGRTQFSSADDLCGNHEKVQTDRLLRRLQRDRNAPSTVYNMVTTRNALDLRTVPPPVRPHPAMDVTFLFAPSQHGDAAPSSVARGPLLRQEELSFAAAFNSSQIFNPSESGAEGRSGNSAITSFPDGGDSSTASDFSLEDRRRQLPPDYSAFSGRIHPEGGAGKNSLPAYVDDISVGGNIYQSQNAEIRVHPGTPSYEKKNREEAVSSQLQTMVDMDGLQRVSPQLSHARYPLRQNNFEILTQEGVGHSDVSNSAPEGAGGKYAASWHSSSDFPGVVAKADSSIFDYSSLRNTASPADAPPGPQASSSALNIPAEGTTGLLPALLGHLVPLLSPLLRLQVLTGRLLNLQHISGGVSTTKDVLTLIPHVVAPVRSDQVSTLTPSWPFAIYPSPNLFSTSTHLAGIMPFLSELLTGMSLPHGVFSLLDPSGQKLPPRADTQSPVHDSANYNISREVFHANAEVSAGIRREDKPAGSAQSIYAAPQEGVVKHTQAFPSTAVGTPPLWHIGDTPLASGSSSSTQNDSMYPASVLHPPLPRPNRGGNMTAPNFPPRPTHSNPLGALPTEHLRYMGDVDGDMADFLNSVIQRVWRTSSGPSSFMRVPPPLYSHRAPEGIADEVAVTLERGNQPLQQEGEQVGKNIATFLSKEDKSLHADSEVIGGPIQNEFATSRWIAHSQDGAPSPSILFHAADDSSPLSFQTVALQHTQEAKLRLPAEEMSSVALEHEGRSTETHEAEFRKKSARHNTVGDNGVGQADGADEENMNWTRLVSSQHNNLSIRDRIASTHPVSTSPTARADSDTGDGADPDAAANVVRGWARGKSPESLVVRRSIGCEEENSDGKTDLPYTLRCRTGTQGSTVALPLSQELHGNRLKRPFPFPLQRRENTEETFLSQSQLSSLRRDDPCVDRNGDYVKESGKINVISTGSDRPAASDKDSVQLLSIIPCNNYHCSFQADANYSSGYLSPSTVRRDGTADKHPVHVRLREERMSLTTKSAGDEKREEWRSGVFDHEKAAEPAKRYRTRINLQATNHSLTENATHPCSNGNDDNILVAHVPCDVQGTVNEIHESPAKDNFQFINAELTVHSPRGDGDSRVVDAVREESGHISGQKDSENLSESLPSENSVRPNPQAKGKYGISALLEDPASVISPAGAREDTVNMVWGISKQVSHKPHLPQNNLLRDLNSTLFLFREAQGSEEDWPGSLEHTTSDKALTDRTPSSNSSTPYETSGGERFRTKQLDSVDNLSPNDETVRLEYPWSWEDTEEDFFMAFNGFPTPYDYYFPLNSTEEDPDQLPHDRIVGVPQGRPQERAAGTSHSTRHDENPLPAFSADSTITPRDASEPYEGVRDEFFSFDTAPYRGVNLFENRQYVPVGDEEHPVLAERPLYSKNESLNPPFTVANGESSLEGDPPFLSKLSSFFQTLPLAEWLRLDPTQVGPFDWKKVFGDLIPTGRRFKRAKEMAHDVILNEYCNRTASESSAGSSLETLGGFSFSLEVFPVPDRIQSDFQKCVEYYRVRTKEYVEEYRNQCQEVWEDPRPPNYMRRGFITIDDVADCLVQKYDVGRRWFNELFYQPWYRLMNQTSYLLEAVDTAFAEFQYDAWFFPAAYSAANFGLWRSCSQVEDCFTGERCVEALPGIYNFTLSFCHRTPESMNLDPITGMPLGGKFS